MANQIIYIELNEALDRIEVAFKYDQEDIYRINGKRPEEFGRGIRGRHWDQERRIWTVPMDLQTARHLREIFGPRLKLGPALRAWAREQVNIEKNLKSLHSATDAELHNTPGLILDAISGKPLKIPLPPRHPFRKKRDDRSYQRADIAMMAIANAINANDVGTGKTLEAIGSIYEAQLYPKPVLVIAPRRSLVNVWKTEFERFTDYEVLTSEDPKQRSDFVTAFTVVKDQSKLALALIADDLRLEKYRDVRKAEVMDEDSLHACRDYKGNWYRYTSETQRALFQVEFGPFIIDEFHRTGLNTRTALFHIAAKQIKAERCWPMSGTPIGGKPRRLWPILNFIAPEEYSSEWRWIEDWLEVEVEEVYVKGGRKQTFRNVGGIRNEVAFAEHHKKHMTRRLKRDALPGLPSSVEILVDTPMSGKQLEDYLKFDAEHEIVLEGKRLSGSIVLSQYLRLRQLANACLVYKGKRWAAEAPSNKLELLADKLEENGIHKRDFEPGARAYIGVLDTSFLDLTVDFLMDRGIEVGVLSGKTKDSKPILDRFESDDDTPYVIAMTIQTGGAALNLEAANSAHALDEDWDPDVMYQFFGRGDRGSRDTALKCYTYRTPDSIQEYVSEVAGGKKVTNTNILNFAREIEIMRKGR